MQANMQLMEGYNPPELELIKNFVRRTVDILMDETERLRGRK
jgi:hypothetical protein